ncbi:D-2-hydroxyacid dehydrogenase [Cytospora mali]|uniref:D-2-hydroxyacid dehydrogenase n=1 Tax=Cytospora mali TaxID=578113 RepID=A0A194W5M8_CYTMA|nr:D-2-hydroxyacid dehydrogenase [Valsa mali]
MDTQDVLLMLYAVEPDQKWENNLLQKFPGKLQVRWVNTRKPDGSLMSADEHDPKVFEGVTMLFTYAPVPADLVPKLRFVQLSSAGSDLWQSHPKYLDSNVKFATTSGSNPPQIAEWVIGQWLKFQHHFSAYDESQKKHYWEPGLTRQIEDSVGLKVGILGYGAIGRQVSRLCRALGMEVYAFTASERPTPESRAHRGFNLPNLGDPEGQLPSKWFHGTTKEAVNNFLSQDLDMLVISLPLTKLSKQLIGKEQLQILGKKKAFVVNIARGPIVDQEALIEALEHDVIRGAALDVTDPEPLPADHPLWDAKNCVVTPHVSWLSTHQSQRAIDILTDNVVRLLKGEALINDLSFKARTHHED